MESTEKNCRVCPLSCGAGRSGINTGACGAGSGTEVAHIMLHRFEEPFISGKNGSGTVFFAHCPLKCVYCQNHKISRAQNGAYRVYSAKELSDVFLNLQSGGSHNINLVTPTHYTDALIEAVRLSRGNGLTVPIVWNTSGYENAGTIAALKNTADIFLTDFKYYSDALGLKYSGVKNYFKTADAALRQMLANTGKPRFSRDKMMRTGVVVRHLLLPSHIEDSKKVLNYLYSNFGDNIYISIMNQFTPTAGLDKIKYPELNHAVTEDEYSNLIDYAADLGIKKALVQEGGTADESFIPEFI